MSIHSVSVKEAIVRGLKIIALPAKVIMIFTPIVFLFSLILNFSPWDVLWFPAGVLLSLSYTTWATTRWRIWAYQHVADIHQLQRSAELAGLLMRQSYDQINRFASTAQSKTLEHLIARFSDEPAFVDDLSIPSETLVYSKKFWNTLHKPFMILNKTGIQLQSEEIFKWDRLHDVHIGKVSYGNSMAVKGVERGGFSKDYLRFEYDGRRFEIPLSSVDISAWLLDLLLYVYHSRSE